MKFKKGSAYMYYNKEALTECFASWNEISKKQTLPDWDHLPGIDLYMDQVITLVTEYISSLNPSTQDSVPVTQSMINNYVKFKTMPAPVKKKYSKTHLAYIIMICILKQTLSMDAIHKIIPAGIEEEEVKSIYNSFVKNQNKAFQYVTEQTAVIAEPILKNEGDNQERLNDLVMQVASSANIFKSLIEKIIASQSE